MDAGRIAERIEAPPVGVRLRYHLLGLRVPEPWRGWVEARINAPEWPMQEAFRRTWPFIGFFVAVNLFGLSRVEGIHPETVLFGAAVFFGLLFVTLASIVKWLPRERAIALRHQRGEGIHPMRRYGVLDPEAEGSQPRVVLTWFAGPLLIGGAVVAFLVFFVLR